MLRTAFYSWHILDVMVWQNNLGDPLKVIRHGNVGALVAGGVAGFT